MKLPKKSKIADIDIEDLYAVKIRSIWQAVKQEHISFWALTAYFFFEYVRPQAIYTSIDVVPWAQLCLITAILGALSDRTVRWVSCIENKLLIFFFIAVLLSGLFAFKPLVSWSTKTEIINWVLVYFLAINILNTEKRFFIFFAWLFIV